MTYEHLGKKALYYRLTFFFKQITFFLHGFCNMSTFYMVLVGEKDEFLWKGARQEISNDSYTFSHASLTSFNHKSGSTCITKTLKEGVLNCFFLLIMYLVL